jgi:hypothetical protein
MMRLRGLAPPLRSAVYVAGALLVFFVAVGLGAAAALVVGGQSERTQAGNGGSAGSETLEGTAAETTTGTAEFKDTASGSASSNTPAFEETMPGGTSLEETTAAIDGASSKATEDAEATEPVEPAGKEVSFVHRATDGNSRSDYTYLDHPTINGEPDAVVLVTVSADREGAQGAYGHNIGVWYESGAQKWAIFNQDLAAVPAGATFRVVLPPASESFVHRANRDNNVGNATYLDNPLTNGKADALVSVTQNWNPGGGGGVYNDHPVGVLYDEDVQKWAIYNTDGSAMPEGAAFNVAVSGGDESTR